MATYDVTRFRASHNSYSGGERGPLRKQLDAGVRCVEIDFHDNGFQAFKDYRIGHLKAGAEVARGAPNPDDAFLGSWLGVIASWSDANPGHEPVTVVLDAKDDLTDNTDGDIEDLNRLLDSLFGSRLFTRDEFDRHGAWLDVDAMRGRILCVLSGNGATRGAYRWAFGTVPALGANANGDVVLAYRSTSGDLNCWTGHVAEGASAVSWLRKGTLAMSDIDLSEPAIAINDEGWVVAVFRFGPRPGSHGLLLESRLGRLQDDGRISWFKTQILAAGTTPSVRLKGDDIELIHATEDGAGRQLVTGTIDHTGRKIRWQKPKKTVRALFQGDRVEGATRQLHVSSDQLGAIGCAIDGGVLMPVRFRQVAFVERQNSEDPRIFRDALFFAAGAANRAELAKARSSGLVARAWGFTEHDRPGSPGQPLENFPATDTPHEAWYLTYVE